MSQVHMDSTCDIHNCLSRAGYIYVSAPAIVSIATHWILGMGI